MIGFIGMGNMARAMIGGIIKSSAYTEKEIYGSAKSEQTKQKIKEIYNVNICTNTEVVKNSKFIFLAVKPYMYEEIIAEIKDFLEDKILISIAPKQTIEQLRKFSGKEIKCVSSMPNTPSLVLEGMSAISLSSNLDEDEQNKIVSIFESFGKVEIVDETLMDTVIAVSGSSPAYVYMFIEALADGAVRGGMKRELAYKFAAQAVLGSAKMVLETGEHPAKLKDDVCSPNGNTIEAIYALKKAGFQGIIMEAMKNSYK